MPGWNGDLQSPGDGKLLEDVAMKADGSTQKGVLSSAVPVKGQCFAGRQGWECLSSKSQRENLDHTPRKWKSPLNICFTVQADEACLNLGLFTAVWLCYPARYQIWRNHQLFVHFLHTKDGRPSQDSSPESGCELWIVRKTFQASSWIHQLLGWRTFRSKQSYHHFQLLIT